MPKIGPDVDFSHVDAQGEEADHSKPDPRLEDPDFMPNKVSFNPFIGLDDAMRAADNEGLPRGCTDEDGGDKVEPIDDQAGEIVIPEGKHGVYMDGGLLIWDEAMTRSSVDPDTGERRPPIIDMSQGNFVRLPSGHVRLCIPGEETCTVEQLDEAATEAAKDEYYANRHLAEAPEEVSAGD